MKDEQFETLLAKLDALVRLAALSATAAMKRPEQFLLLSNVGLSPKEIAEIVGTTPNTVSVTLSTMRKKKKGRR